MAWWLMPRTQDAEVWGSSPTRAKPCCVLEEGTFTPQKVLVILRKRWLRPNMTEKLFTGTLRINQPTNKPLLYNTSMTYCPQLAPGDISLTSDWVLGDDSKQYRCYIGKIVNKQNIIREYLVQVLVMLLIHPMFMTK